MIVMTGIVDGVRGCTAGRPLLDPARVERLSAQRFVNRAFAGRAPDPFAVSVSEARRGSRAARALTGRERELIASGLERRVRQLDTGRGR